MIASFGQAFSSSFLADLAVAILAFIAIEWQLHLRRDRHARQEVSRDVLQVVRDELAFDVGQADLLIKHLPSEEVPYPLFDVNGWSLLSQAQVLTVLAPDTAALLVKTYNRLRTANELFAIVNDLYFGATAVVAVTTIEAMPDESTKLDNAKRFNTHRDATAARLIDRAKELRPYLADAVKQVDGELSER